MITSRVVLGLMTFGPSDGGASHAKIHSLDEFNACLDEFQSHGYSEVDTAWSYCSGKQENFTAQGGYKARKLTLATKCYPRYKGAHSRTELLKTLDTSLNELNTDCVDIFYLHAADRTTPFQETLAAVDEAHKQGKFKIFAISNFTAAEVAEVCLTCKYNSYVRPTLYQGAYNVINRTPEYDLVPTLRRFGLDWVVYNPLAGGMLTGRYLSKDAEKTGRFAGEGVAELYAKRYWQDQTFAALNIIDKVAKASGIKMTELAIRWLQHHSALKTRSRGGNDGIVTGASSLPQLRENMEYFAKGPLPAEVVVACDEAWAEMAGSRPLYYHGEYKYEYDTEQALFGKSV